jgi:hypothetical protein
MSKAAKPTCGDCYFHQASLCALVLAEPCPTFRLQSRGSLVPPRQPPLVPRQVVPLAGRSAA